MSIVAISTYVASRTLYTALYPEIIIKSITTITSSLISGIYNLITITQDIDLKKILVTSDIVHDITVIKSFVKELEKTENNTVMTCVHNLNETLKEIETTVNSIKNKFELHQKMWFSYFRSYDISSEKDSIIFLSNQLKHRFELLIKISSTLK
jgi:phenylalanyl-tRNA synthetase alpha subunit